MIKISRNARKQIIIGLSIVVPFVLIPTGMDWKLQAKNAAVNEEYYSKLEAKLKDARLKYDELDKEYFSMFKKHLPAPNLNPSAERKKVPENCDECLELINSDE